MRTGRRFYIIVCTFDDGLHVALFVSEDKHIFSEPMFAKRTLRFRINPVINISVQAIVLLMYIYVWHWCYFC